MKNICSILSDLQAKSDFVRLIKENHNYFLCAVDDYFFDNKENWKTKNLEETNSQPQAYKLKIEITQFYPEFIKYITFFTNSLVGLLKQQQNVENLLFNKQDTTLDQIIESFFANPIAESCQSMQSNQYKSCNEQEVYEYLQNLILQQDIDELRASKKLEKIVNNFYNLMMILMIEQGDLQVQFKNPQNINVRQFKTLQFEKLAILLQETFHIVHGEFEKSRSDFQKIEFYLQKQNLELEANHLEINLNYQETQDLNFKLKGDKYYKFEGFYNMPSIKSNYIYFQCYYDTEFSPQITINLYPYLLIDNYRGKCVIVNNIYESNFQGGKIKKLIFQQKYPTDSDFDIICRNNPEIEIYDSKVKQAVCQKESMYGYIYDRIKVVQIPSILNGAYCFIYDPKVSDLDELEELMLEDQMILLITVLNKYKEQFMLQNSVSMITADLFYI
ncbi:hypothetical protein TTHERM_00746900 (macronuclear) [Tetrahymena thermophila SB210]|uniref:Uncharacterized protein n=1 Tax=Tetrahymena thermophila (strain SB210) TaxID=312017 RepID=Q239U0_TETTS|nr:hypothetical protein TTHERM_00746900 [Tetrahymena thermophila SB210]EAR93318.2 hypothetical protein TTHERM_00746900 [Tetrahymena thermophila SB210]|eukprot:XP_001013563.2 hypothetical protein TTHERM_00746900 [Tetrahymena thermophila SB210]